MYWKTGGKTWGILDWIESHFLLANKISFFFSSPRLSLIVTVIKKFSPFFFVLALFFFFCFYHWEKEEKSEHLLCVLCVCMPSLSLFPCRPHMGNTLPAWKTILNKYDSRNSFCALRDGWGTRQELIYQATLLHIIFCNMCNVGC